MTPVQPPIQPPAQPPIGLQISSTAKTLSRAFDQALAAVDGSLPMWMVLTSLKSSTPGAQRQLAAEIGIEGPTLTHHLNRMERAGLVTRRRDDENRRVHRVELTDDGEAAFFRLLSTVQTFDRRIRSGFTDAELTVLRGFLHRLAANVSSAEAADTSADASERMEVN